MDVISFHWLKNKTNGKYKWLRNNASTMSSQLIDTVIFITIAFYGVVDNIILMIFAQKQIYNKKQRTSIIRHKKSYKILYPLQFFAKETQRL